MGAKRARDGVGVIAGVDGLDGSAQCGCLGEQLERERADLAVGRLGVHPDAVQSHVFVLSSVDPGLR